MDRACIPRTALHQPAPASQSRDVKLPKEAKPTHRQFGPTEEELTRMNTRQLHPIPKDVGGGRKMTEREFERVFQIPGNGHGVNGAEPPIPDSCKEDNDKGMTSGEVITQITEADQKRLNRLYRTLAAKTPRRE